MTVAYWCVFVMILFPIIFATIAKKGGIYDNHDPRQYLSTLTGFRKRANSVQLNSFESFPAFAAAIIIAQLTHAQQHYLNMLAVAYVIARTLYAICYLTDKASFRTLFWMIGMICIIGCFCLPR